MLPMARIEIEVQTMWQCLLGTTLHRVAFSQQLQKGFAQSALLGPRCYLAEEMIDCCSISMVSKPLAYGSYQPFALDLSPTVKTGFREKLTNTRRLGASRFPSLTGMFDDSRKDVIISV